MPQHGRGPLWLLVFEIQVTPTQIRLVKESFRKINPSSSQIAVLFYARLFELDPSLRMLFRGDMVVQGDKLMSMLSVIISMLSRIEVLIPQVRELGVRHAMYGVKDRHYATMGVAFLWTVEKALGPDYTEEVRDAWSAFYAVVADSMMDGARSADFTAPTPVANVVAL